MKRSNTVVKKNRLALLGIVTVMALMTSVSGAYATVDLWKRDASNKQEPVAHSSLEEGKLASQFLLSTKVDAAGFVKKFAAEPLKFAETLVDIVRTKEGAVKAKRDAVLKAIETVADADFAGQHVALKAIAKSILGDGALSGVGTQSSDEVVRAALAPHLATLKLEDKKEAVVKADAPPAPETPSAPIPSTTDVGQAEAIKAYCDAKKKKEEERLASLLKPQQDALAELLRELTGKSRAEEKKENKADSLDGFLNKLAQGLLPKEDDNKVAANQTPLQQPQQQANNADKDDNNQLPPPPAPPANQQNALGVPPAFPNLPTVTGPLKVEPNLPVDLGRTQNTDARTVLSRLENSTNTPSITSLLGLGTGAQSWRSSLANLAVKQSEARQAGNAASNARAAADAIAEELSKYEKSAERALPSEIRDAKATLEQEVKDKQEEINQQKSLLAQPGAANNEQTRNIVSSQVYSLMNELRQKQSQLRSIQTAMSKALDNIVDPALTGLRKRAEQLTTAATKLESIRDQKNSEATAEAEAARVGIEQERIMGQRANGGINNAYALMGMGGMGLGTMNTGGARTTNTVLPNTVGRGNLRGN